MPPGTDDGQDVADDPEGDYRRRHLRSDMPTRSGISEALQICRAAGQDRRRHDRRDEVRDEPQHVTPLPDECHRHEFSGQVRREFCGVDLVVEDALCLVQRGDPPGCCEGRPAMMIAQRGTWR